MIATAHRRIKAPEFAPCGPELPPRAILEEAPKCEPKVRVAFDPRGARCLDPVNDRIKSQRK